MRAAVVERLAISALISLTSPRTGLSARSRIGDVALLAGDDQHAVLRAAPAELDGVAERGGIARLAQDAMVELFAALGRPFSSLTVPLTAMPSSSPVIRNEIEPFGLPPCAARWSSVAASAQAIAPFMSTAPRPYSTPPAISPANGGCDQSPASPGGTTSVWPANIRCGAGVPMRA